MKQKLFALTVLKFALPMLLFGNIASANTQGSVTAEVNSMTRAPYPYTQCVSFSYNMARGSTDRSTNYEVTKLQKYLKTNKGTYPEGWVTGYFGPATQRAVKRLQIKFELAQTGVVDESLRAVIKESTCGGVIDEQESDLRVDVSVANVACTMIYPGNGCGKVANVTVALYLGSQKVMTAYTNYLGIARFGELEPGNYRVHVSAKGYTSTESNVQVIEGNQASVFISLSKISQPTNNAPVIDGVKGPTVLQIGEIGTWSVTAHNPNNGSLSYSVKWGDEYIYSTMGATAPMLEDVVRQTSTFTHAYQNAGTYTVVFYVKNDAGETTKSTMTVTVGRSVSGDTLRVISPNGGEMWNRDYTQVISWTGPTQPACPSGVGCVSMAPRYYNITLEPHYPPCTGYGMPCPMYAYVMPYKIADNVYGTQYNWRVGQGADYSRYIPEGQYKIKVCDTMSGVCDSSDSAFILSTVIVN